MSIPSNPPPYPPPSDPHIIRPGHATPAFPSYLQPPIPDYGILPNQIPRVQNNYVTENHLHVYNGGATFLGPPIHYPQFARPQPPWQQAHQENFHSPYPPSGFQMLQPQLPRPKSSIAYKSSRWSLRETLATGIRRHKAGSHL